MRHIILITGAAGYIGAMLVERFAKRGDIERIIGIDKEPMPENFKSIAKLAYLRLNTADDWEGQAHAYYPTIVIHTAWQIREMYGAQDVEWKWNIGGSGKVFDFALGEPSVKRLVHFSTVASYGSFPDNSTDHRYTENEPFRKTDYRYAEEKRIVEQSRAFRQDCSGDALLDLGEEDHVAVEVHPRWITLRAAGFPKLRGLGVERKTDDLAVFVGVRRAADEVELGLRHVSPLRFIGLDTGYWPKVVRPRFRAWAWGWQCFRRPF